MSRTLFHTDRVFFQEFAEGGASGWYFQSRGFQAHGPFPTRTDLLTALRVFVKTRAVVGDAGPRGRAG
ncbi:MAG: hypothetical protein B7Z66_08325 [Chromatiales bacterium 21-64-14]|nr:MAG: hypothetical protein B7Z66_08325 [Chromatiales bacterium 21-64-14]HQU15341.1 hypothetical protein [Gammaproteobacteria bacterium]